MRRFPFMALAAALFVLISGCADAPTPGEPTSDAPDDTEGGGTPQTVAVTPRPERPLPTPEELAALRKAVEQAPDDKRARRRLAIALFEAGNIDESLAMFEEDVRTSPGAASLLNLGRAYDRVLRYPEAEATYRKVLEVAPTHPTALHALGNLALKRGDGSEAVDLYRRSIASKPDYLMAHAHLGDALKRGGDSNAAYESYANAVNIRPTTPQEMTLYQDAVYNMASIDMSNGLPDRAAGLLEDLLRANPGHLKAHYAYGQALLMLGREEDAQRAFDTHMRLQAQQKPTSPMAMGD